MNETPEVTGDTSVSYAENGSGLVAAYTAADPEDGQITWSLSGDDRGDFSISNTGEITFKTPPDHEDAADVDTDNEYLVTIQANDGTTTGTLPVAITVTNADEAGTVTLSPAQPHVDVPLTAALTDPDGDVSGDTWVWESSTDGSTNWVAISGATTAAYPPVAEDVGNFLRAKASYTDGQGPRKSAEAVSANAVQAAPVTNVAPDFPRQPAIRTVAENTPTGRNVGAPVSAADPNNGDTLTYSLGGADVDSFTIVESSGQLKTKDPLDHEATKNTYTVTVTATDSDRASTEAAVTITVTNVNEPPVFSGSLGTHSVAENTPANQNIGNPVTATDPDKGDTLTYSLGGTDAASFTVVPTSGQLRTSAALDYETKSTYSVTVIATDSSDASDEETVTITVTNVNEDPAFSERAPTRSVTENTETGEDVGNPVTATDPDGDTLIYTLSGRDVDVFEIAVGTGQLQTKADLDYESNKRTYTVTVSVSDGKNAAGAADTASDAAVTVTITVIDENEPPQVTTHSTARYAENGTAPVGSYTATDPENEGISWMLAGIDGDDFTISNSGVLAFKTPPNFEAPADADENNVYLVTVEASDGNSNHGPDVTVTVYNVNEPPAFPAETGSRSVDENTAAGVDLGLAVSAVDPEMEDTLIYRLAGQDGASFAIDTSTGQLRTRAPLDYETKSTYLVTVHVRDSKDQDDRVNAVTDDTINLTITINNVEEPGELVLSSRQPQVGTLFTATLTDPDGGVSGVTWIWKSSTNKSTWSLISDSNGCRLHAGRRGCGQVPVGHGVLH